MYNAEQFAWKLKSRGIVHYINTAREYTKSSGKKWFSEEDYEDAYDWAKRAGKETSDFEFIMNSGRSCNMQNLKPCPYCGGQIEMVKLNKKPNEVRDVYRIECKRCRALVARGEGFPCETISDAEERIKDYNREIARVFDPMNRKMMLRPDERKALQDKAKRSMIGPDDEEYEDHDAKHRIFDK